MDAYDEFAFENGFPVGSTSDNPAGGGSSTNLLGSIFGSAADAYGSSEKNRTQLELAKLQAKQNKGLKGGTVFALIGGVVLIVIILMFATRGRSA